MEQLLKAIQSRKLDRIAAAYAVGGWILVQAGSIAQPAFDLPAWSLRAFIIFICAGFPVALLLTWFIAPRLPGGEGESRPMDRRHYAALALASVVLLLSAGGIAYRLARVESSPAATATASATAFVPQKASIAVLPFDNMSGDDKKVFFSDGISEEILNDLANVPALRVAARASSFSFRGKNDDIRTIARQLGVRTILQGSVRESGLHLRIIAQLVNADDGYVIWSSAFDRDMTDVLVVQDEIARAITVALTNHLLPESVRSRNPHPSVMNPEAYTAYLEGQYALGPRTADGTAKALVLFQKATALQPDFAEGFAALGRAYINVSEDRPDDKTLMPAAKAALLRALELAPDNLNALATHLDFSLHELDWPSAIADAERMKSINPGSAVVLHEMFRFYQVFGFADLALQSAQAAAQINPLSVVDRLNIVAALLHNARYSEAASVAEDALSLHHDQPFIQSMLCTAYAHTGRVRQSRQIVEQFTQSKDLSSADSCQFDIAMGEGHSDRARIIMDKIAANYPKNGWATQDIGDNYAIAGDYPAAIVWLSRSYDKRNFALFTIPTDKAIAPEFFQRPDWLALWDRPLAKGWKAAHDTIAGQLTGG